MLKGQNSQAILPSWETLKEYALLYLKHCNYQPLPLFSEALSDNLVSYDPELLLAIAALALRFKTDNLTIPSLPLSHTFEEYATPAKEMIMRRIAHGPVDLSTLQTLCLLSLAEFNSECL